jgi:hypothetical protein
LPLSDKRADIRFWSSAKTKTTLSPSPISALEGPVEVCRPLRQWLIARSAQSLEDFLSG